MQPPELKPSSLFPRVAELAGMGVWQMDCASPLQVLDWDGLCYRLHDTDPDRFQPTLGATLLLYEDESRARLEDALMSCSVGNLPFDVEVELMLSSGMRRLRVAGSPEEGGRYILGYYQDISARQQVIRKLELEQSQLRALLKTLPDMLFGIDSGGFFRDYYSGQCKLLSEDPESYLGRHVGDVFPYLRHDFSNLLKAACDSGDLTQIEFQVLTASGEGFFEARILPLERVHQGHRALLLLRDITEQHLRAEQLRGSQQAALQASRAKSQFLANMSHEIRTPLNGMLGMTELLLGTDLTVEQREYAQQAMTSTQGLLEIVNDILDLSKIEANRLVLESIPFSPRAVVQDALASLSLRAHEKGLEIVGSVDSSVPSRVVGDPTRVRQLLTNLLSNAIKFTSQGEVELQLSQREPGVMRVSVYDTGEGIQPERQGEIFEPFTQADGTTTRRHGGTGLGLTICRQIVEKMGGKIWLESQPGQGSRFSFTLKLPNYHTEGPHQDTPYQAFVRDLDQPDLSASDFAQCIQNKRVLIVDDNASCRRMLKETLITWGIEAQVAVGPGPALQAVRESQRRGKLFDLALVDFQMPGCDGLELVRELPKELLSLLMVTLGRPTQEQLEEAGVRKVMVKPLLGNELARTLLELFRAGAPRTSAAQQEKARASEPKRILMAEDNMVNAKVVSKMLQRLGHEVFHVVNGQLAVDFLKNHEVDVVLMDVQMPVMDGFEATRRWRSIESTSNRRVPIVALTGNALASDREMCLEAGMDLHLTKPIRLDLLDQMLSSLQSLKSP